MHVPVVYIPTNYKRNNRAVPAYNNIYLLANVKIYTRSSQVFSRASRRSFAPQQ